MLIFFSEVSSHRHFTPSLHKAVKSFSLWLCSLTQALLNSQMWSVNINLICVTSHALYLGGLNVRVDNINMCHFLFGYYQEKNEKTAAELKEVAKQHCSCEHDGQDSFLLVIWESSGRFIRSVLSSGLQSSNSVWKSWLFTIFISSYLAQDFHLEDKAKTSLLPFSILRYANSCSTFLSGCFIA